MDEAIAPPATGDLKRQLSTVGQGYWKASGRIDVRLTVLPIVTATTSK